MPVTEGNIIKGETNMMINKEDLVEEECESCEDCQCGSSDYRFDPEVDVPAWERYQLESLKDVEPTHITGGHPMFHTLLERMRSIHDAKNADYGDGKMLGNFMEAEDFGVEAWRGALVRLSDKYSRVKSLAKRVNQVGEVKDESFSDTLLDLANYALLTLILYEEK